MLKLTFGGISFALHGCYSISINLASNDIISRKWQHPGSVVGEETQEVPFSRCI